MQPVTNPWNITRVKRDDDWTNTAFWSDIS